MYGSQTKERVAADVLGSVRSIRAEVLWILAH